MLFKKPSYPINPSLLDYLERFDRISKVPISYDDLLRFSGSINVYDKNEHDTLWIRVYYNEFERNEIPKFVSNYFELQFALEDLLCRKVDLLEYAAIRNPFFKEEVDETRKLIFESLKNILQ